MVVRTAAPADVSQEPPGPCNSSESSGPSSLARLLLGTWVSQSGVSQEHGAPVPSQVYKLLTTGRCRAAQSDAEALSLKILAGRQGPGGPRTKDVGRLLEGPPKVLIFSSQNMRLSPHPKPLMTGNQFLSTMCF